MNAKRKKQKSNNFFETFGTMIVLAVLLGNIWAGWKIFKIAEALEIPGLGTIHDGPMQLAVLLLINCILIISLAAAKGK